MPASDLEHTSPRPNPPGNMATEGKTEGSAKWAPFDVPSLLFWRKMIARTPCSYRNLKLQSFVPTVNNT